MSERGISFWNSLGFSGQWSASKPKKNPADLKSTKTNLKKLRTHTKHNASKRGGEHHREKLGQRSEVVNFGSWPWLVVSWLSQPIGFHQGCEKTPTFWGDTNKDGFLTHWKVFKMLLTRTALWTLKTPLILIFKDLLPWCQLHSRAQHGHQTTKMPIVNGSERNVYGTDEPCKLHIQIFNCPQRLGMARYLRKTDISCIYTWRIHTRIRDISRRYVIRDFRNQQGLAKAYLSTTGWAVASRKKVMASIITPNTMRSSVV